MENINFTGMTGAQAFRAIDANGGVNDAEISANMEAWARFSFFNQFSVVELIAAVKKFGSVSASYASTLAGHLQNCTEFDSELINEAAEELMRKDKEVKCMAEKIKALEHDHRLEFEQMRSAWEKRISDQAVAKLKAQEWACKTEDRLRKELASAQKASQLANGATFDLRREVEKLKAELEAVGAGKVQPLRKSNFSTQINQQMLEALRKTVAEDEDTIEMCIIMGYAIPDDMLENYKRCKDAINQAHGIGAHD